MGVNQTSNSKKSNDILLSQEASIFPARVRKIYLELDGENNDWNKYGWIRYIKLDDDVGLNKAAEELNEARPLYSHFQNFPLENEIVYIISFPSQNAQLSPLSKVNYYIDTISIWNHSHHGALPDTRLSVNKTNNSSYTNTEAGNPIKNPDSSNNKVDLGKYFATSAKNLQPLLSFEGDRIYQGRSGNSIRFSSTQPKAINFWNKGDSQKPILIIANGDETEQSDKSWYPRVEDPETDSLIILADGQTIDITLPFTDLKSFNVTISESNVVKPDTTPTNVNQPEDIETIPETDPQPQSQPTPVESQPTPTEEEETPPQSEENIEEDVEFVNEERTAQTEETLKERKIQETEAGDVPDDNNKDQVQTLLTLNQLKQILGPSPRKSPESILPEINKTLTIYNINTPLRITHFLAQVLHESGRFGWFTEFASGKAYEGRTDLGNTQPGDGVKYKGRGAIQITGRSNYSIVSKDLKVDFVNTPDLLTKIEYAILSAGWYWNKRKLNRYADIDDIKAVTKRVNGGFNGLQERIAYYNKAKTVLNSGTT
jgi:predicted chitinase